MFIVTADPTTLAQEERNDDSTDNISLLRSLLNYVGPVGYKHFVPTGLKPVSCKLVFITQKQNTNSAPTKHHRNFTTLNIFLLAVDTILV